MQTTKTTVHELAVDADFEAADLDANVAEVCDLIAPSWPLDRFLAVNPLWGMVHDPLPTVSKRLASLSGARLLMPRSWYRQAFHTGRIRSEHLRAAIHEADASCTVARLIALLASDAPSAPTRARVMDVVDAQRDLSRAASWREYVVDDTSQLCAAYFDDQQSQLGPDRRGGLYATFRRHAQIDRRPALQMGHAAYREAALELPEGASALVHRALSDLGVPARERSAYLLSLLLDVHGWASRCAELRWTARLEGRDDGHLAELLAVRLASEWLLWRSSGEGVASQWRRAMAKWPAVDAANGAAQAEEWLLQRALELAWHGPLCEKLTRCLPVERLHAPLVQAVFCIDVRSELLRRALEAQSPAVQTLGFAGFFGLPIAYQALPGASAQPQLPGLLAPRMHVTDTAATPEAQARRSEDVRAAASWQGLQGAPASMFAWVESVGLVYGWKLLADGFGHGASGRAPSPGAPRVTSDAQGRPLSLDARCELAASILRGMSLTRGFAPLVLLIGHTAETRNNPHAAALACGACGGQSGELNARTAAALLNDPAVREGLAARGIAVPLRTRFVAAVHNTTTDAVTLLDADAPPPVDAPDADTLAMARSWLRAASTRAGAERAGTHGAGCAHGVTSAAWLGSRARDWAELRPEWGLANNATLIVAPRELTRHIDLEGRAFLHEYRYEEDQHCAVLELIMTAPLVVAHWINFQYYASTVDNLRYGSGNKTLHNVVGRHLGVFEGNGGDLRTGLPLQCLHDGERWVHTPLRLSVFIAAPRGAIEGVLRKHAKIRDLAENQWIDLFQLDAQERAVHAYRRGQWHAAGRRFA